MTAEDEHELTQWLEARPFSFDDLEGNPEPEKWGSIYDIKRQRGKTISEVVRAKQLSELHAFASRGKCHVNIKADLKYKYSSAKANAAARAAFHAQAAADRRAWAAGTLTIDRPGFSGNIVAAYEQAMAAKRARLARKPHYLLRDGQWRLAA
jgi:hypothetical protein